MTNKIKISLEKGIISDNDWNDINKLSSIINDCINIENGIKDINLIDEKIKKCNLKKDVTFIFDYKDNEKKLLNNINEFGSIKEEEIMQPQEEIMQIQEETMQPQEEIMQPQEEIMQPQEEISQNEQPF